MGHKLDAAAGLVTRQVVTCDEANSVATIHAMGVRLLVVFVTVWSASTLLLSRLPWFQRREQRDHPNTQAHGVGLAEQAENWLSSLHDAPDPAKRSDL